MLKTWNIFDILLQSQIRIGWFLESLPIFLFECVIFSNNHEQEWICEIKKAKKQLILSCNFSYSTFHKKSEALHSQMTSRKISATLKVLWKRFKKYKGKKYVTYILLKIYYKISCELFLKI